MRAIALLCCLAPTLAACGGGDDAPPDLTCRLQTPERQYRIHHEDEATGGTRSPGYNVASGEVAVRLDAATLAPVACGHLDAVRFHWWSSRANARALAIRIYGTGTATEPGPLLREQVVVSYLPMEYSVVALDSPVALAEGEDLWIGLAFTMPSQGYATIGMDAGPRVPGVNFTCFDGIWAESLFDDNFAIQALVYH